MSRLETPVAFMSDRIGMALDLNPRHIEFFLGWQVKEAIRLPTDFQGHLLLKYDSKKLADTKISIGEMDR